MSLTSQSSKQDIILTVLKGIVLLDFQDAISVSFADTLFLNKDVLYLASALCKYYISRFLLKNVQVGRKPQQEKTNLSLKLITIFNKLYSFKQRKEIYYTPLI